MLNRKRPKATHFNTSPVLQNDMSHVTFSDEVLVYVPESTTPQPSASRSHQPADSIGINSRHPSPPEHRPSIIPSIRPETTIAAPSPRRPNQSSGIIPFSFPLQSSPPPSTPTYPTAFVDSNATSSRTSFPSTRNVSSTEGPLDLNRPPLLDENRIISLFKDICYGHDDCIGYEVLVSPSSLLLEDEMALYKAYPATEPYFPLLTIEAADLPVTFKVQAGDAGFVTVWDVLDTIFQHRNYLGDKQFCGFSITTDGLHLQLHLVDIDGDD